MRLVEEVESAGYGPRWAQQHEGGCSRTGAGPPSSTPELSGGARRKRAIRGECGTIGGSHFNDLHKNTPQPVKPVDTAGG